MQDPTTDQTPEDSAHAGEPFILAFYEVSLWTRAFERVIDSYETPGQDAIHDASAHADLVVKTLRCRLPPPPHFETCEPPIANPWSVESPEAQRSPPSTSNRSDELEKWAHIAAMVGNALQLFAANERTGPKKPSGSLLF